MLILPNDVVALAFCPTGPGGGVDPTCSPSNAGTGASTSTSNTKPQKAAGSSAWPEDVKKKLRALQSKLSRAKTVEAKAKVALAINALIAEQNGVKAPAPKAGLSAKEALLEAAKHVPIQRLDIAEDDIDDFETLNAWATLPDQDFALYKFKTPSGRLFTMQLDQGHLVFDDNKHDMKVTGKGEAHFVFGEISKAVTALATRTKLSQVYFSADQEKGGGKGRQKLYARLASGLAELVPGATVESNAYDAIEGVNLSGVRYFVNLRKPSGVELAFCPTGPGGGVDPTCSPANAGTGGSSYSVLAEETGGAPVLKKAKGTKNWPDAAKKKLRALQSKLSRAKTAEAKALVIKAINAHIDAQTIQQTAPQSHSAKLAANAANIDIITAKQKAAQNAELTKVDAKVATELNKQAADVAAWYAANPTEGGSVRWYTASGSMSINKALRKGETHEHIQKSVTAIDKLTEQFSTPKDLVVTRSVGPNTQQLWKEGYVHEEKGYTSCSVTAVRHAGYLASWDKKARCVITVPKGTKGAYVSGVSAYPKERELLLARGLKFRVTRREENVPKARMLDVLYPGRAGVTANSLQHKEYTLIHMEVLPPEPK